MWSVVDVERREQQDVRDGHARNVQPDPAMPELPSRRSSDRAGAERENAEDEQVRVLWPPQEGERSHGQENDEQTPVVDRARGWMTTGMLGRQHGADPGNGADQACGDVHRYDAQEHW